FGHHSDDSTRVARIFRLKIAGYDLECLDGIGVGVINNSVAEKVIVRTAIKNKGVGIVASSGDTKGDVRACGPSISRIVGRRDAGLQQRQVEGVPAIEWKVLHCAAGNRSR